jgi:hypothetical protein
MVRRHVRWGGALLAMLAIGCGGTSKPKPAAAPPAAEAPPAGGGAAAGQPQGQQIAEGTAKDFETLVNRSVPFALEQIDKHGEFYPYATVITKDDKFEPAVAKPNTDRPTSQQVIDMLVEELRRRAAKGELRVVCIVVGGRLARDPGSAPSDVIQARLEHVDGTAVEVYVPWTRDKDKKVQPGEGFAGRGVPVVFTK